MRAKNRKSTFRSRLKMNAIHFRALTHRYFELIWNDKLGFFTLLLQAPLMLLVMWLACTHRFIANFFDAQTALFVLIAVSAVMGTLNSYREVCKERDILAREYAAGLDASAYVVSKIAVQACIALFHAAVLTAGAWLIFKLPVGNWWYTVPNSFLIVYLCLLSSSALGIFISCLLKNSESAILPILFLIMAQMVLSDTLITLPEFAGFVTYPVVTKWGVAALGSLFGMADMHQEFYQHTIPVPGIYATPLYECYVALAVIFIVSILLSIFAIKRAFRTKV